jgi:hypothetical protein
MLEQEIHIFSKCRREIRDNKDFEYEVIEHCYEKIDLSGKHQFTTTFCNSIHTVCYGMF